MIRELLHPTFLRAQLERLEHEGSGRLEPEQYKEMYDELDVAIGRLPPSSRAPGGRPQVAHLSSNPKIGIFQSVLSHCIDTRLGELAHELAPGQSPVAEWGVAEGDLFKKFGPCDPLWIESALADGIKRFEHKPAFPDRPADPAEMADRARMIVVGDWGTGLPQAVKVATQMRKVIEQGRAEGVEQHLIHLGDTYYSGWKEEYERRFVPHWPVAAGERDVRSWTLNGNHDMYSGGHGYFGYILRDPRFAAQCESSHFTIQNASWQIVGLDSSYEDQALAGHQADWLSRLVSGSARRTMLLTHHQPFSRYGVVDPKLGTIVERALGGHRVEAWLWGHEHRCAVYERNLEDYAGYTSVIGHGGVPVLLTPHASAPDGVAWEFDSTFEFDDDNWSLFGFAVLEFDGPRVDLRYVDENGHADHTETIA